MYLNFELEEAQIESMGSWMPLKIFRNKNEYFIFFKRYVE